MSNEEITRIEKALAVELPQEYRAFMTQLDSEELQGNADSDLWDDPDAIIERNLELRKGIGMGGKTPWPDHLIFIGDPLSACANAIDISEPGAPVHWIDHCAVDARSSGKIAESFVDWAQGYMEENG